LNHNSTLKLAIVPGWTSPSC